MPISKWYFLRPSLCAVKAIMMALGMETAMFAATIAVAGTVLDKGHLGREGSSSIEQNTSARPYCATKHVHAVIA